MDRRQLNVSRERYRLTTASSVWPPAQTQQESRTAQHDYGKDEGDRANMSLAGETDLAQKSRDRVLLNSVDAALKRISEGTFGHASLRTFLCGSARYVGTVWNEPEASGSEGWVSVHSNGIRKSSRTRTWYKGASEVGKRNDGQSR